MQCFEEFQALATTHELCDATTISLSIEQTGQYIAQFPRCLFGTVLQQIASLCLLLPSPEAGQLFPNNNMRFLANHISIIKTSRMIITLA